MHIAHTCGSTGAQILAKEISQTIPNSRNSRSGMQWCRYYILLYCCNMHTNEKKSREMLTDLLNALSDPAVRDTGKTEGQTHQILPGLAVGVRDNIAATATCHLEGGGAEELRQLRMVV